MDHEALKAMDEKADSVITHWSFAALGGNLLPPPADMFVVAGMFAAMGGRLGNVYGVKINLSVLRGLGVGVAKGIGSVLAGSYVGSGLLKYVPGVNIWVALLVQPPVVGATAYAAGHAFKMYYHAILSGGRALTTDEVVDLATKAFTEKLESLRESGYEFRGPKPASEEREPIEIRPYEERQLIVLAGRFGWRTHAPGRRLSLRKGIQSLRVVGHDEIRNLRFPPGHPRVKTVYAGHPLKPHLYYLAADFHRRVIEQKVVELSRMLQHLGANHITIAAVEGYSSEANLGAALGVAGAEVRGSAGHNTRSSSEILFETSYRVTKSPRLLEGMVWFDHEDLWQAIAEGRLSHGTTQFALDLKYCDDYGINANLGRSIAALKIDIGGEFAEFKRTVWHVSGTFEEVAIT